MSAAFAAGAAKCFPGADLTHDKFHTMKLVSEAVDKTRRLEVASRPELKGTRYIFLKNPLNLTESSPLTHAAKNAEDRTALLFHAYWWFAATFSLVVTLSFLSALLG